MLGDRRYVDKGLITVANEPQNSTMRDVTEKENVEKCDCNAKRTCKTKQKPKRTTQGIS
jgi:hypothetical protein